MVLARLVWRSTSVPEDVMPIAGLFSTVVVMVGLYAVRLRDHLSAIIGFFDDSELPSL